MLIFIKLARRYFRYIKSNMHTWKYRYNSQYGCDIMGRQLHKRNRHHSECADRAIKSKQGCTAILFPYGHKGDTKGDRGTTMEKQIWINQVQSNTQPTEPFESNVINDPTTKCPLNSYIKPTLFRDKTGRKSPLFLPQSSRTRSMLPYVFLMSDDLRGL